MGYRTVNHVPSIYTYAQARQIFDKVVPIRNRDIKPLGQRRDADTYHIRMNNMGDVECVLYKTAVVTFHPDETVTLTTDGWDTVSTHQFIWAITGCATRGSRGKTVIKIGNKEYVMSKQMKLKFINEGATKWEVLTTEEQYDWRLDRQKANIVRAKYKEFTKYLTSSMKLRTVNKNDYKCVEFSPHEMADEFGTYVDESRGGQTLVDPTKYRAVDSKGEANTGYYKISKGTLPEFMQLIGDEGENKHAAYYKAMLMLAGRCYSTNYYVISPTSGTVEVSSRAMLDKAYECMYKWHSEEVLVRVKLAEGKVPTGRYDSWI